jgi:hypothetical protein
MNSNRVTVARPARGRHRKARPQKARRGGRSSFFALGAAALLVAAAFVAPQAFAADDGNDVNWLTSDGAAGYNKMINAVRQRATGGRVLREGVLETDPNSTDFFTVNVGQVPGIVGDVTVPAFRLIVRQRDLFVLGWVNGDPDDQETVFFLQGDDNGYRGSSGEATLVNLPFGGNYTDLERVGRARVGTALNSAAWVNAERTLNTAAATTSSRDLAQALTMYIMGVAEGARFDTLQNAFAPSFNGNGDSHTVTEVDAELMNNWSNASQQLLDNLNNRTPINFRIDDPSTPGVDIEATTVSALTVILGIALIVLTV